MRQTALILIALAAGTGNSWAQSPAIDSLVALSRNRELNEAPRLIALDSLAAWTLRSLRAQPMAKSVPLPENALRTESPDGRIVLVTLNAPLNDGSYAYRGIAGRPDGSKGVLWVPLEEGQWPEAIIYRITSVRYRRKTYYMSLWFKPHLNGVQEKGIEPVIPTRGRLVFGARVFAVKRFNDEIFKKAPERLVLRYGPMATATVRSEKPGVIVIDEVAPIRDAPRGEYRFYGPTAVQNRLIFRDGKWRFETSP